MSEIKENKEPLNKNNKVPKLRFDSTVWEEKRIGNLLKMCNGKDQKAIENSNGKYNIYGTGGIIGKTDYYLYDKESIGIGRKGTIDKPFYFDKPFWTVDTLFWSKIQNGYFPKFIYYLFQTIDWKKLNQSTGVPSLTSHVIEHQKIYVPDYNYQVKLSKMFDVVESKILAIESKINILKKYKKGLAKEAIKETINYWKFGIGKALDLSNYLVEINEYSEKDGTFPHITLSTEGISDKSDRYDRDFLVKDDNKKYKITRLNQLCYNPANLKFGVICINRYGDGIFSPIYVTFRIKNIELDYLELIITSNDFNNYSMKYQQGTVYERMAVSPEDLCKIKLVVNDDHKQKNIAYAASILNEKISKLECELNNLKIIKTNLLNNMFI